MAKIRTKPNFALIKSPIHFRLMYLCELVFGGKLPDMATAAGMSELQRRSLIARGALLKPNALARLVSAGVVNAEWLLCGTGPMRPDDQAAPVPERLSLPATFSGSFPVFDSFEVAAEQPVAIPPVEFESQSTAPDLVPIARRIHAARSANKPVILGLGDDAMYHKVGPVVATMLRKGYVTALAMTAHAVSADLELALYGDWVSNDGLLHEMTELHSAAKLAAAHGMGYGEAIGRWAYPVSSDRRNSPLSVACELNKPVTVHAGIGEAPDHFLPALHAAELGAAIGAASYTDMWILTQELLQFGGSPGGVFLTADESGQLYRVFRNAMNVVQRSSKTPIDDYRVAEISWEYRLTFPALLSACDAVYDGSADDGKRNNARGGESA